MIQKSFNFSSGPAILPTQVKLRAAEELMVNGVDGLSVMEISHRSDRFHEILEKAERGIRELLSIPLNYRILFMSGGASLHFSMIPYNFLGEGESADYISTGYWSDKASKEAEKCGRINRVFDGRSNGFRTIPTTKDYISSPGARYLHYCANETIHGNEFDYIPQVEVPLVCDASSNILSKAFSINEHSMIYAGAQKNIGPSGVSIVIIKDEFLETAFPNRLAALDYRLFAENDSMPNTPNTWGIFIIGLVCDWIRDCGGVDQMEHGAMVKSGILYQVLDKFPDFYLGYADLQSRSRMNITFNLRNTELEEIFLLEAEKNGFLGLRGHRSLGGIRASLYNAFPMEGVERLADFMIDFHARHS